MLIRREVQASLTPSWRASPPLVMPLRAMTARISSATFAESADLPVLTGVVVMASVLLAHRVNVYTLCQRILWLTLDCLR